MPTKAEIEAELQAIESKHIAPGKWVRFESHSSSGRSPVVRKGVVTEVDLEPSNPHASPMVVYTTTSASGETKEHRNRPSMVQVIRKPSHH